MKTTITITAHFTRILSPAPQPDSKPYSRERERERPATNCKIQRTDRNRGGTKKRELVWTASGVTIKALPHASFGDTTSWPSIHPSTCEVVQPVRDLDFLQVVDHIGSVLTKSSTTTRPDIIISEYCFRKAGQCRFRWKQSVEIIYS